MKKLIPIFILILLATFVHADEIRIYYTNGSMGVIDAAPGYADAVVDIAAGEWGESIEPSPGPVITDSYGNEAYAMPESDWEPIE